MKKIAFLIVAGALSCGAFALDITVSNEYWCTWGYVNAATNSACAESSSLVIDTKSLDLVVSAVPDSFDTHGCGCVIIVR